MSDGVVPETDVPRRSVKKIAFNPFEENIRKMREEEAARALGK